MCARVRGERALGLVLALAAMLTPGAIRADMVEFPSAGSDITGVTDIGGGQFGWFWSTSLDQGVREVLADPQEAIARVILDIEIPQNALTADSVQWAVTINDLPVGSFAVDPGFTGVLQLDLSFAPIPAVGGAYDVALRVTNDVALLGGSHTLGFADPYRHSINLIPEPVTATLLSIGGVMFMRRRRRVRVNGRR